MPKVRRVSRQKSTDLIEINSSVSVIMSLSSHSVIEDRLSSVFMRDL